MRNLVLAVFALATIMATSSCNSGALVFNNKMVEVQKALEPKMLAFGSKMEGIGENGDIKTMTPDAKSLIEDLDKSIAKIKALEAPKNGEEFKRSMLAQLEYMKKFCKQTVQLGDESTTEAEKLQIATDFMKAGEEATKLEEDTQAKQREFAKANGFKIQN
jgi:hypothetical protein